MRFELDLDKFEVHLLENVNIKEIKDTLKEMFPDTWKEFDIVYKTINAYNPWYSHYYTLSSDILPIEATC